MVCLLAFFVIPSIVHNKSILHGDRHEDCPVTSYGPEITQDGFCHENDEECHHVRNIKTAKMENTDITTTSSTDYMETMEKRSVLILNTEWGTSNRGISTVNRQIIKEAKQAGFDVHVTALEVTQKDRDDASKQDIHLIAATKEGDDDIDEKALNKYHHVHFPNLNEIKNLNVIIGHIPITSQGALDIRKKRFKDEEVNVFLFCHVIPEDVESYSDDGTPESTQLREKRILQQSEETDVVFSVGPKGTEDEIQTDLEQSHLFLMPSRTEAFGIVGMEAIAAGIPTLVSSNSGLATFLTEHFGLDAKLMIVNVGVSKIGTESDIKVWKTAILEVLGKEYKDRFRLAQKMKETLKNLPVIAESQDTFVQMLTK
ncbi:uncharacterized protein LOC144450306 [Glandiceps talaboti]